MRSIPKILIGGVAAVTLAGLAGLAGARIMTAHVMDVRLPDGSVTRIHYVGDTPPTVRFVPAQMAAPMLSLASDPFGPNAPFLALERMSEAMDQQAAAMFQAANAAAAPALAGSTLTPIDVARLPPGVHGFAMVSTTSGDGFCTRSIQYQASAPGATPRVLTRASGDCGADQRRPALSVTSGRTPEARKTEPRPARTI